MSCRVVELYFNQPSGCPQFCPLQVNPCTLSLKHLALFSRKFFLVQSSLHWGFEDHAFFWQSFHSSPPACRIGTTKITPVISYRLLKAKFMVCLKYNFLKTQQVSGLFASTQLQVGVTIPLLNFSFIWSLTLRQPVLFLILFLTLGCFRVRIQYSACGVQKQLVFSHSNFL